jgi:hypothetical protein
MTGRVPMNASRVSFTVTCFLSLLLLSACGSGDLGGILGGGDAAATVTDVRGTVDRVDTRDRVIVLRDAMTGTRSLRGTDTGTMVELRYDDRTTVTFQGRNYRPEDLEPGDRIEARVDDRGRTLLATRIEVTHDVRTGSGTVGESQTTIRGTIRSVDTRDRRIELDRTDGLRNEIVRLEYDSATTVDLRGRQYRPEALERGDTVDVRVRTIGNRVIADEIFVVQSVSGTGTGATSGDVRGIVRAIDTRSRTIELERTTWGTRFTTAPQGGDRVLLDYTSETIVEFQGNRYTPENLERGDEVDVWLDTVLGRSTARRIVVVRDVRAPRF